LSNLTEKTFTVIQTYPNEEGVIVSRTIVIENVIHDLIFQGPYIVFKLKDESVRRLHQESCVDINEVIIKRDAISAPAI